MLATAVEISSAVAVQTVSCRHPHLGDGNQCPGGSSQVGPVQAFISLQLSLCQKCRAIWQDPCINHKKTAATTNFEEGVHSADGVVRCSCWPWLCWQACLQHGTMWATHCWRWCAVPLLVCCNTHMKLQLQCSHAACTLGSCSRPLHIQLQCSHASGRLGSCSPAPPHSRVTKVGLEARHATSMAIAS